jgi:hypothetical protein
VLTDVRLEELGVEFQLARVLGHLFQRFEHVNRVPLGRVGSSAEAALKRRTRVKIKLRSRHV